MTATSGEESSGKTEHCRSPVHGGGEVIDESVDVCV